MCVSTYRHTHTPLPAENIPDPWLSLTKEALSCLALQTERLVPSYLQTLRLIPCPKHLASARMNIPKENCMLSMPLLPLLTRETSIHSSRAPSRKLAGCPSPRPTPQPTFSALSVGTQGTWTKYTVCPRVSKLAVMCLSLTRLWTALGQGPPVFYLCISGFSVSVSGRLLTFGT